MPVLLQITYADISPPFCLIETVIFKLIEQEKQQYAAKVSSNTEIQKPGRLETKMLKYFKSFSPKTTERNRFFSSFLYFTIPFLFWLCWKITPCWWQNIALPKSSSLRNITPIDCLTSDTRKSTEFPLRWGCHCFAPLCLTAAKVCHHHSAREGTLERCFSLQVLTTERICKVQKMYLWHAMCNNPQH